MVRKINFGTLAKGYLIFYFVIMLIFTMSYTPRPNGEWDDYSLSASSIMTQHNLNISDGDIAEYKNLFPDLGEFIDSYRLSGHIAKDGGEMPWYFPTYSIACIPMIKLLQILGLRTSYGFALTNLASVMLMLFMVLKLLKVGEKRKLLLIILLSVNPIIFYYNWISCEAFMYVLLGISMVFWCNKNHKLSAFFLALSSTMNPTILMCGIVMIADYLIDVFRKKPKEIFFIKYGLSQMKNILIYGLYWVISLVPFVYNFYNTGYINLTAAYPRYTESADSVFRRSIAYLFDWNFGILPYFTLIFIISLILFAVTFFRRNWSYIKLMTGFFLTVYAYSIMAHVNCGMAGISRYNVWSSVIMLFAFAMYFDKILSRKILISTAEISTAVSVIMTGSTIYKFGINKAMYTDYKFMTPVAEMILDNAPSLYNPLHSTFYSRIVHKDGGYNYITPVIYCNDERFVRKILADSDNKDYLLKSVSGNQEDMKWFAEKLNNLDESDSYINIPKSRNLRKTVTLKSGDYIFFYGENYNADKYIVKGFWAAESSYSWTVGKEAKLSFSYDSEKKQHHCVIDLQSVFGGTKAVSVVVNGIEVFNSDVRSGENIEFDFENSDSYVDMKIQIPDAEISRDVAVTSDTRALGIAVRKITIL